MALLFMDSFDHYVTADLTKKYAATNNANSTINATAGRRGGPALSLSIPFSQCNVTTRTFATPHPTVTIGFAFKATVFSTGGSLVEFLSSGVAQASVGFAGGSGNPVARRGTSSGTTLGTATTAIAINTFTYVEVKIAIHASAGTVGVRLNGADVLTLTGVNTSQAGTAVWDAVKIGDVGGALNGTYVFDDLYLLDGSGSAPWNTFLGDCRVDARRPTAPGATTGWTPSTGANWAAVDDAAPNDDTDYTAAAAAGLTDTFVTEDAPVVGATIYGVQHCLAMKKTDAGVCTVGSVIRHGGVDYVGANLAPGTTYAYGIQIAATNPGTGAAWVEADFNAAEFGYKRTT